MANLREYVRHRLIGTPFDPIARTLRRRITIWQSRKHTEIRDALLEDDFLHEIVDRNVKPGDNCVDVGSHLGAMTHHFLQRSPTGKHTAVEPTPYKAEWLTRRYPQVKVVQAALAEEPGELTFYHQPNNSGYSGLSKHDAKINDVANVQEMKVRCERLDDIVPAGQRIGFIKIDVEGAELRVLKGGRRVLTEDRPTIIFECTESGLNSAHIPLADLFNLLTELRYEVRSPRGYLEGSGPMDLATLDKSIRYPFAAFSFIASPMK